MKPVCALRTLCEILSKKYDYVIYIKNTNGVEPLDNYINWHKNIPILKQFTD